MGVYTFVVKGCDGDWSGKQLKGDLEASAATTYELQRKLVHAASAADPSSGVQSSFSFVSPSSAVFQVIIGGAVGGGGFIGGGAAAAAPAGGAPAAEAAPAKEEKKEEKKEESDDEDFGMSLFD